LQGLAEAQVLLRAVQQLQQLVEVALAQTPITQQAVLVLLILVEEAVVPQVALLQLLALAVRA